MKKPKIGKKGPDFKAQNQDGKWVSLSDFRGKKLVLYFYPKDDTPACTAEACNLRDHYMKLKKEGYTIIGISKDSIQSHLKFKEKYQLPFDLLSDENHAVAEQYRVWKEKSMFGKKYMGIARTTFLLDANGVITDIIEKVNSKEHANQILNN